MMHCQILWLVLKYDKSTKRKINYYLSFFIIGNNMFFDDDDFEDSSDEQLQLWQEDELTRYIKSFERKLTEEDRIILQLDIIEKYFPV